LIRAEAAGLPPFVQAMQGLDPAVFGQNPIFEVCNIVQSIRDWNDWIHSHLLSAMLCTRYVCCQTMPQPQAR